MHEVAAQAATKKLNPESLAMRADEAGSVGSPDVGSDRAAQGASLRTRYCLCSGVQTAVMRSRARPWSKWHGEIRRNGPDLYGMTEGPR
jgi:hypothetical protein